MSLGTYVKLDQSVLYNGNFSDTLLLTGTVYSDAGQTAAFSLSGYTITMRLYRDGGLTDFFNQTGTIVSAAAGTFSVAITEGTLPSVGHSGVFLVDLALSKSGTRVSNLNRVELLILRGPTA